MPADYSNRSRATVAVAPLLDSANYFLAHGDDSNVAGRLAVATMIERILHDSGNYRGFCYIGGWPTADESRREYFRSPKLAGVTA
jgi:hypothetical protein